MYERCLLRQGDVGGTTFVVLHLPAQLMVKGKAIRTDQVKRLAPAGCVVFDEDLVEVSEEEATAEDWRIDERWGDRRSREKLIKAHEEYVRRHQAGDPKCRPSPTVSIDALWDGGG